MSGLNQKTFIWLVCQNMHIQISLGTKNYVRKNDFEMLDQIYLKQRFATSKTEQ